MKKNRIFTRFPAGLLLLSVIGTLNTPQIRAQDNFVWTNTTGSPNPWYDASGNWAFGSAPTGTDRAIFNSEESYSVWWDGFTTTVTPSVGRLRVSDGQVTFLNQDSTTQHQLVINGIDGEGVAFWVTNGAVATIRGLHFEAPGLGGLVSRTGSLHVDGSHPAGSRLSFTSNSFFAGQFWASGNVIVSSGGELASRLGIVGDSFTAGHNSVTAIDGSGSVWSMTEHLIVGTDGGGTLNITNGGLVTNGTGAIVGLGSDSPGEVNVSGPGSQWNSLETITVGHLGGTGSINISGGGRVESSNGIVGVGTGSVGQVSISGADSQWLLSDGLMVGQAGGGGIGRVDIVNGGRLTAGGEIEINAGGELTYAGSSTGFLTADGGWLNSGSVKVSQGIGEFVGDFQLLAGGTLETTNFGSTVIRDNLIHNGNTIQTADGSALWVFGQWRGAGNFTGGGNVIFQGQVNPGNSTGVISFGGDVLFGSSTQAIFEIAGLTSGDYDQLLIAGDFQINGTLDVLLLNDFNLGFNQTFVIADVMGSLLGEFNGLSEGDVVGNFGGIDLFITYQAGSGNSVALFTAIPEPCSLVLMMTFSVMSLARRRRLTC